MKAVIRFKRDAEFYLRNLGQKPIFVDRFEICMFLFLICNKQNDFHVVISCILLMMFDLGVFNSNSWAVDPEKKIRLSHNSVIQVLSFLFPMGD